MIENRYTIYCNASNTRRRRRIQNVFEYNPIWSSYKSMSKLNYYFGMDNIFKSQNVYNAKSRYLSLLYILNINSLVVFKTTVVGIKTLNCCHLLLRRQ